MGETDTDFVRFVRQRRELWHRWAYLASGDWHTAEDLVQTSVVKLYLAWSRIDARHAQEAYARRILQRTVIDDRRRRCRRPETPVAQVGDEEDIRQPPTDLEESLRDALAALPDRQRTAVVLRYLVDMSVTETATVLECSPGTVKSQCSRALTRLRRNLQQP